MSPWWALASNTILLIVSSILVADVSMGEEIMLLVLTGLATIVL